MPRTQILSENQVFTNDTTTESSHRIHTSLSDAGDENDGESSINRDVGAVNKTTENDKSFRSSVWKHATKITPDTARCNECGKTMKTVNGSTSSLRKHLLAQHSLVPPPPRRAVARNKTTSLSNEKKSRLDHLLKLATFEDGRSFGDFRKSGMSKFLTEAVPGENIVHPKTCQKMYDDCKRSFRWKDDFLQREPVFVTRDTPES